MTKKTIEIKGAMSAEIDDLWKRKRDLSEPIFALLYLTIGPIDTDTGDNFTVILANPMGLLELDNHGENIISDHAIIIFREFDWRQIYKHLQGIVEKCDTGEWDISLKKLQKYFNWEYEGYQ